MVLARGGEGVVHFGDSGCPPLFDIERYIAGKRSTCQADYAAVLRYVGDNTQFTRVVLAFRGAADVTGTGFGRLDTEEGVATYRLAGAELSPPDAIEQALDRTIEYFRDRRKDVWLILQVPELGFRVTECIGRPFSFEKTLRSPCAVSRGDVDARQASYRRIVHAVSSRLPDVRIFDPMQTLCDAQWCYATIDGKILYEDSNHLSDAGSEFVAERLFAGHRK